MNTLNLYPRRLRKNYEKNIRNAGISYAERYHNIILRNVLIITFLSLLVFFFLHLSMLYSLLVFVLANLFFYFKVSLQASTRIKKMEQIFPDVISLMASNLRSGITIDRSFLLSARPEFAPLDQEIFKTGKDIATGKDVVYALKNMAERIDSEKITKTTMLIISGIKAGGNISDLLEQTSSNMKEKEFIEKRAVSSILMYVIFIFFAVGVGAPVLFSLSSVLVEIITKLVSNVPIESVSQMQLPVTFSKLSFSPNFVIYFSVIFIIFSDLISSLVMGLVNKGEGKAGLRFFIPLVALSLGVFFILRIVLGRFFSSAFAIT